MGGMRHYAVGYAVGYDTHSQPTKYPTVNNYVSLLTAVYNPIRANDS